MNEPYKLYNDLIMDRFLNPKHIGKVENENAVGEVGSSACGDIVRLSMNIDEKTNVVNDAKILVFGCQTAIAAADMMAELIKGKDINNLKDFTNDDILNSLGGKDEWMAKMPQKIHCSVLAESAISEAVKDFLSKRPSKLN